MTPRSVLSARFRGLWVAVGLGLLAGLPAGVASFVFLETLARAIALRENHATWLIWCLPIAAFAISGVYHHIGERAAGGTGLVMTETDAPTAAGVPRRMAPLVWGATVLAHMFGASVGREGVALQMAGSLADGHGRYLRLTDGQRRTLLHAALAGGFGSVFGVPWAGVLFAFEVRRRWRSGVATVTAAVVASVSGDRVVTLLGHRHPPYPQLTSGFSVGLVGRTVIAGVVFGAIAALFVTATEMVRRQLARVAYPPLRAAIAGVIVVVGASTLGRQYLSLSLPLATASLAGLRPPGLAWLTKLGFTAVSVGGGIPGGEVTPLFVTGATLGGAVAVVIHAPIAVFAGLGFVAVFGAAAKTPLACTVMFAELFGTDLALLAIIACAVARLVSGRRAIYPPRVGAVGVAG